MASLDAYRRCTAWYCVDQGITLRRACAWTTNPQDIQDGKLFSRRAIFAFTTCVYRMRAELFWDVVRFCTNLRCKCAQKGQVGRMHAFVRACEGAMAHRVTHDYGALGGLIEFEARHAVETETRFKHLLVPAQIR